MPRKAAAKETIAVAEPEAPLVEIARLIGQKDAAAANRLSELSLHTDKAVAKEARRGMYVLKQAGIEAPATGPSPRKPVLSETQTAKEALITNPDGNGNQMLMFVQEDSFGGSPWLITFLVSYAMGLRDLGASKLSRKDIAASIEEMRAKPGRVVVDAPVDYTRWLLQEAVERNRRESLPIPQGYSDDLKRVGAPEKTYERPLIYDTYDSEQVFADQSFSHEPDKLFENDLFKAWLINLRIIAPWAEKYIESHQSAIALDEAQMKQRAEKVIDEAADALLSGSGSTVYRRLLEESALTLHLAGQEELARQTLYQALTLQNGQEPHAQPFLRALTARSIFVLIALYAREEEAALASEAEPAEDSEPPGLIERV